MAAPKEIGRKPNGMGECRPSCGCVQTTRNTTKKAAAKKAEEPKEEEKGE